MVQLYNERAQLVPSQAVFYNVCLEQAVLFLVFIVCSVYKAATSIFSMAFFMEDRTAFAKVSPN